MSGLISQADITAVKTEFYTIVNRDDSGSSLLDAIRRETQSMSKPPNWLLADCMSHLLRSYGRFYHVANKRSSNFVFVDCQLTQFQKDAFKATEEDRDVLYEKIPTLLQAGYKLTTSWNGMRGSFCATLLAPDTSRNSNKGLSAFAGDIFTAMRLAVFKHFYILEEDWSTVTRPPDEDLLG